MLYPQPQSSLYYQEKQRIIYRNTNAREPISLLQRSKYKPKNLLHPYRISKDRHANDTNTSEKGMINKIMSMESADHEVEFYMTKKPTTTVRRYHSSQMADGDKKNKIILENALDEFQQQRFTNDQKHIINMIHKDIIRPVPCKPIINDQLKTSSELKSFKNPMSHLHSSQICQSILPLNRTSTWRKLQANITPSHYNRIQEFQRDRQQQYHASSTIHPIMLPPLHKRSEIDSSEASKFISNITDSYVSYTSLSIDSPTNLSDSSTDHRIIQSIDVDHKIVDNDDNSNTMNPITNSLETAHQLEIYPIENIVVENKKNFLNQAITNSPSTCSNNDLKDDSSIIKSVQMSPNASSLHETENIEELQTFIEILSPSQVPSIFLNDILSSFFPTISTQLTSTSSNNNLLDFHSHHYINDDIGETPYVLFDNTGNMTEILSIDPLPPLSSSSFVKSKLVAENHQPKKVHSLFESIEELCILIRTLLQHELTRQKITPLQATIASQLAILLTYLAIPNNEKIISGLMTKNTIERMISTDENDFSPQLSTVETQTDIEWTIQLNDQKVFESPSHMHFHSEPIHNIVEFSMHEPSSSEIKQEEIIDTPLSSQKVTSHTDLTSTSISFHLPGRRPNHAFSDTFIYHIHQRQQYSSSYHQLISFSETTINSLMHPFHHHWTTKEETKHLFKRIGQKLQHYIELDSSNTCLEASTEFTPDFVLTTINNSKYDDDDDDQTEQFGIDTEKQDYQTDTISLVTNEQKEKTDTLTFNSTEKDNYDSLDLDIEQDNEEHLLFTSIGIHQSNQCSNNEPNIEENSIPKSSVIEIN
ncbi:unnamed protein product [Rotaria sp. Silwood2]|nr:unnamed protein product [Rotaria sp. Silwood2]CAF2846518.1 unnamed protein product [Rotaria sp. Silwood2]CAF3278578.1 unnamed protein product [Rotaria sp. Silwood2]CAF3859357.1 unnamed protein product [Rotaria sp. Silwood2]CAF4059063.1 unnamed protein product [Rotaria sp. Silwood2]